MTDLSPLRLREREEPVVRLRCDVCEVAWSGEIDSSCWVCGASGDAVQALVRRYDVEDISLDFD